MDRNFRQKLRTATQTNQCIKQLFLTTDGAAADNAGLYDSLEMNKVVTDNNERIDIK